MAVVVAGACIMSRTATIAIGLAAFIGAGLAAGIMWYRMTVEGFGYTFQSWILIAPLWAAPVLAAWIAMRWPLSGGLLLVATSLAASWYFSDVFGFAPGALIFGVGLEHSLRSALKPRVEAVT